MIPQLGNVSQPTTGVQTGTASQENRSAQAPANAPVVRTEIAQAVPAVARPPETGSASKDHKRNLNPPDPNAPAGPPPSFEASILDRAREEASASALEQVQEQPLPPEIPMAPENEALDAELSEHADVADLRTEGEGRPADVSIEGPEDATAGNPPAPEQDRDPYFAPPTSSERAEAQVATLRALEADDTEPKMDTSI